jgi:hypothetical protein
MVRFLKKSLLEYLGYMWRYKFLKNKLLYLK